MNKKQIEKLKKILEKNNITGLNIHRDILVHNCADTHTIEIISKNKYKLSNVTNSRIIFLDTFSLIALINQLKINQNKTTESINQEYTLLYNYMTNN